MFKHIRRVKETPKPTPVNICTGLHCTTEHTGMVRHINTYLDARDRRALLTDPSMRYPKSGYQKENNR